MSVRIMSMVFENQELTSTEKLIMLALADHANDEGKSIYPSQSRLSRKTGFARPTVNRHIHSLIDKGYLKSVGYKIERANVLELEIIVEMLGGVTENDTPLSPTVTPPVTQSDTNHHITKNNNHQLKDSQPSAGISLIEWQEQQKKLQEEKKANNNSHKEVVGALMEVTGLDMKIKTNAGRIYKASKELRDAGYGVDDIMEFGRKWKQDWRFRQDGKPPVPETILKEICHIEREDSVEERKRIAFEQIEKARQTRLENGG